MRWQSHQGGGQGGLNIDEDGWAMYVRAMVGAGAVSVVRTMFVICHLTGGFLRMPCREPGCRMLRRRGSTFVVNGPVARGGARSFQRRCLKAYKHN